jgi:hypothetical protein
MTCELIEHGICDKNFNCEYFKYEPIPSGVACHYLKNSEYDNLIKIKENSANHGQRVY